MTDTQVVAFDEELRSEQPLGEAETDTSGAYTSDYSSEQFFTPECGAEEPIVRVLAGERLPPITRGDVATVRMLWEEASYMHGVASIDWTAMVPELSGSECYGDQPDTEREPLSELELEALRPISSVIWGPILDEANPLDAEHRLSVIRRCSEYDHHYGKHLTEADSSNPL